MVSSPKKIRKPSQHEPYHIQPIRVTLRDNPLFIKGYNVFDDQYKDNTIHNQICDVIRDSFASISNPESTYVTFQIGRLMSVVQPRNIFLPIETEAVLDYDSTKVKFVTNVSTKCLDSLYLNLFASQSDTSKVVPHLDYLEVELIYSSKTSKESNNSNSEGLDHSRIYRVPFDINDPLNYKEIKGHVYNHLDSLIVYRPQSDYHFRVQTSCIFPVEKQEKFTDSVSKIMFRHVRTYQTSRNKEVKFIKFNLEVVDQWDVPTNEEIVKLPVKEMMNAFFDSFISSNRTKTYSYLDTDNSEESKVKIIQISTDSSKMGKNTQLYRQYKRQMESKDNRFEYIVSVLESNTRMLLDLFDSNMYEVKSNDFYPNLFGDTAEMAQIHYDTRKMVRQQESSIEALRKYNNLVKRIMVTINVKQNATVLDLACGHAQDLDKYNTKKIRKLLGIDISLREINEARRRYLQRKKTLSFQAEFHHGNLLDSKTYTMYVKNKYDVVSLQLAIHYILESEVSSKFILEKVHASLTDGGLFIGSTVCCDQLAREWSNNPPTQSTDETNTTWSFGNTIFKITMEQKSAEVIRKEEQDDYNTIKEMLNNTWGVKYHFFLTESIDESEYVVPWKAFLDLTAKVGFRLVESLTFPEYLSKSRKILESRKLDLPQNVYDNINKHFKSIATFNFSNEQARVFALYKVFVFEKITRRDKLYIQGVKIKK